MKTLLTLFLILSLATAQAQPPTAANLLKGLFNESTVDCDSLSTPEVLLKNQDAWNIPSYRNSFGYGGNPGLGFDTAFTRGKP